MISWVPLEAISIMTYDDKKYNETTTTTIATNEEGALSMCLMWSVLGTLYGESLALGAA